MFSSFSAAPSVLEAATTGALILAPPDVEDFELPHATMVVIASAVSAAVVLMDLCMVPLLGSMSVISRFGLIARRQVAGRRRGES